MELLMPAGSYFFHFQFFKFLIKIGLLFRGIKVFNGCMYLLPFSCSSKSTPIGPSFF